MQVVSITQSYATALEELVMKRPEQYLWMHDLWNDKPTKKVVA